MYYRFPNRTFLVGQKVKILMVGVMERLGGKGDKGPISDML